MKICALIVIDLVNTVKLYANVRAYGECSIVNETVDKVSNLLKLVVIKLVIYLADDLKNVYALRCRCFKSTVSGIDLCKSLCLKCRGNVGIDLVESLDRLVVKVLILSDLILDLLFSQAVKLFKFCNEAAVKNAFKINLVKKLHEGCKINVVNERNDTVGILINHGEDLILESGGYLVAVCKLKNSLCKLVGNVYVKIKNTVCVADLNVLGDNACDSSYVSLLACELYGNVEFSVTEEGADGHVVANLHLVVAKLCDLFKVRDLCKHLTEGVKDEGLALVGN